MEKHERPVPAGPGRRMSFRVGDWVEVRPAHEILPTLDADGCLDRMPFMPEMLQYAGKRFQVMKSAHKTCDTIETYAIRRLPRSVHLEGLRCDGSAHGGCQAGCLLFWKHEWLKPVPGPGGGQAGQAPDADPPRTAAALQALHANTRADAGAREPGEYYRCQATEVQRATTVVRRRDRWNPLFYLQDLTSGNVTLREFVGYGLLAAFNSFSLRWFKRRTPHLCGLSGNPTPTVDSRLQAGEVIRVRSRDEIMQTVNPGMKNRGLWFDVEMVRFCDTTQRVQTRVERLVDEKTGRLLHIQSPCIILDNVTCSGMISFQRMFCPRALYPYWREIWLQRTTDSGTALPGTAPPSPSAPR